MKSAHLFTGSKKLFDSKNPSIIDFNMHDIIGLSLSAKVKRLKFQVNLIGS